MRTVLLLSVVLVGCAARLPPAPPKKVLALDRDIAVVLVGSPHASVLRADDDHCGDLLGSPPVVLERLTVTKELWKYALEEPSPAQGVAHVRRIPPAGSSAQASDVGPALRWTVCIVDMPGAVPRLVQLELPQATLPTAFATGRVEIRVSAPAAKGLGR